MSKYKYRLSKKVIKDIAIARENVKKGKFYTEKEAIKIIKL
jgi:hypothetical protein